MKPVLMFSYARSGGTILNQCLGSLPNTIIMSEVNPLGGGGNGPESLRTIREQAKEWYGLEIRSSDFKAALQELILIASSLHLHLILRDWSFVNFVEIRYNNYSPPNRLLLLDMFKDESEYTPFAFVRNAIDVWLSLDASPKQNYDSDLRHYLVFVKSLIQSRIPIYKYEDFCHDPVSTLKAICSKTGLEFSPSFSQYQTFTTLNGDTDLPEFSRGIQAGKISVLKRRKITKENKALIKSNSNILEINSLLGYPTIYE